MRPIDTQAPADTRRCIQYWPISSSLLADTGIQTRYEGIVSADLALESELEQLTLTGNNDAMNTVLSIVQDAINSDEVQTIRLKARPTVSALDPLAVSMEADSMVCQLARVHPSVSATARESPMNTILPAENGYTRLVSYIQRSARAEAVQTNPTYADGFALNAKPAAKRQRHGIDSIMYESLAADASPVLEPAPPLSGLTISAGANQTNQNGESGHREAAAGLASSHIELLEDFLVNLFQEEDQLSDVGSAKTDYFHNISHRHSDVALLNKRAVLQLRTLLVACSPEQLTAHVPDDKLGRIIGMLVAVVEAADEINLADMIKSGASVDKDAGLSDSFCSGLDQAMSISSLGLDASGVIVSLAATGKASNSVCPGDVLHAAVSLFKDCLLGCVVPLFDLAPGCELAEVFADNDGFLRSRLLAFLGTVLVAHDPIATLVGGPVLAEQDIISLAFACISVTFCCGDLFGSGDGSNLLESIRRAAQSLLRRVFEAHSDQRMWILEEILASLIKLPTAARLQNTYRIAGGKSVQFITVLLLKLLQCSAQSPEDLTAGFEGRRLPVKEQRMLLQRHKNSIDAAGSSADFVVRYLIGRCVKRDSKASTNETEYRVFLEAFIDNCIVLLGHPQWPAAELVTRVYSLHVLDLLDEEKVDINLKALALESTALIASHIAIAQRENEVQAKNGGTGALEFVLASTLQSSVVRFREMTTALLEYLQSKAVGGEST
ncbi:Sister chromatid cohesion protein 2, partial [Coemansia thaxteri]